VKRAAWFIGAWLSAMALCIGGLIAAKIGAYTAEGFWFFAACYLTFIPAMVICLARGINHE